MNRMIKPFVESVAERLIELLQQGTAPWQRPWMPGEEGSGLPMNPVTGKRYKGINALHLAAQGHSDPRWMTYKQAESVGAHVRRGEKGTPVQYWKFSEEHERRGPDGKPVLGADGAPVQDVVLLQRPSLFMATVFNGEQIDKLGQRQSGAAPSWIPQERAENLLAASSARIVHAEGNRACYQPGTDSILLPLRAQFSSPDDYYATALHELGHWTGHSTRLGRDLAHPFGSEGYAREELRAEIASMLLGQELHIGHDPSKHASYVASWVKVIRNDPLEIFRAASDAEKIHEYVVGLELRQRQQEEERRQQRNAPSAQPQAVSESERTFVLERDINARLLAVNRDLIEEVRVQRADGHRPQGGASQIRQHLAAIHDADLDDARMAAEGLAESSSRLSGTRMKAIEQPIDGVVHALDQAAVDDATFAEGADTGSVAPDADTDRLALAKGYALPESEKQALRASAAGKLQQRATQEALDEELGVQAADRLCSMLLPLTGPTPYMRSVGLRPGAGALTDAAGVQAYLPVVDSRGKLCALERIADDGSCSQIGGRATSATFHVVGDMEALGRARALVIAADYASACTLSHALGHATVATLGAKHLLPAAEALHQRYPAKPVIIAAGYDLPIDGLAPGSLEAARAAAQAVDGRVVLPIFAPGERSAVPLALTTFHDLSCRSIFGAAQCDQQIRHTVGFAVAKHDLALGRDTAISGSLGLRHGVCD